LTAFHGNRLVKIRRMTIAFIAGTILKAKKKTLTDIHCRTFIAEHSANTCFQKKTLMTVCRLLSRLDVFMSFPVCTYYIVPLIVLRRSSRIEHTMRSKRRYTIPPPPPPPPPSKSSRSPTPRVFMCARTSHTITPGNHDDNRSAQAELRDGSRLHMRTGARLHTRKASGWKGKKKFRQILMILRCARPPVALPHYGCS
jgi:hypothetical protein